MSKRYGLTDITTIDWNGNADDNGDDSDDSDNSGRSGESTIGKPTTAKKVNKDEPKPDATPNDRADSPQTSDDTPIVGIVILAALTGLCALMLRRKPDERK